MHVLDSTDPAISERKQAVETILDSMGFGHIPTVVVLNKIDALPESANLEEICAGAPLALSAKTKQGVDRLISTIAEKCSIRLEAN